MNSLFVLSLFLALPAFASEQKPSDGLNFTNNDYVLAADGIERDFNHRGSSECVRFWTGLTSITTSALSTQALDGKIQIPPTCVEDSAKLSSTLLVKEIVQGCSEKGDWKKRASGCVFPLVEFRAVLIDRMTTPTGATTQDYEKMKTEILVNKFFSRFLVASPEAPWSELEKMLAVLSHRVPNSPSLSRATVTIRFMEWKSAKEKDAPAAEKAFNETLASAEALQPNDENLKELRWLLMVEHKEAAALEKDVNRYLEKQPHSKVGLYYLAGTYWMKNDRARAVSELEKARILYPEDSRIQETLAKVRVAKLGEKVFSATVNLNFL